MDIKAIAELVPAYNTLILTISAIGVIVLFFLLCILAIKTARLNRRYNRLMKNSGGDSLEGLVLEYTEKITGLEEESIDLDKRVGMLETGQKGCVQKIGLVRYNAYQNASYDLSFSLALLDDNSDGVVVSSLYGRNECVVYAKSVEGGKSSYTLSKEEEEAVKRAVK